MTGGWTALEAFVSLTALSGWLLAGILLAAAGGAAIVQTARWRALRRHANALHWQADQLQRQLYDAQAQLADLKVQLRLWREHKSRAEMILANLREAVLVIDDKNRIVLANRSAQDLFGIRQGQAPAGDAGTAALEKVIAEAQKSRAAQLPYVRREFLFDHLGEPAYFDATLSLVCQDPPTSPAVAIVLHNITREKQAAQMKNEFVSYVSHELKTPLASINAYAEMLLDDEAKDDATRRQFCQIIQTQAQRLTRMIEDILNISRIESGLIKINKAPHSLAMLIRDAAAMIASTAQEKNITVHTQAAILYDQVLIDRDMMLQVLINLLSNAIKYTPAGGSVSVSLEVDSAQQKVIVKVSDTGVGIPPDALGKIFDKFYRVEANNKYAKGTGLGLNLVKQIVETVHQGRVFVESQVGKGSTFGFELPLVTAAQADPAASRKG